MRRVEIVERLSIRLRYVPGVHKARDARIRLFFGAEAGRLAPGLDNYFSYR